MRLIIGGSAGKSKFNWIEGWYYFSFAHYVNPLFNGLG